MAEEIGLEERLDRAIHTALAPRRAEIEAIIDSRIDAAISEIAARAIERTVARRCANCGGFPLVARRRLCLACVRSRRRQQHADRVRRRNGASSNADDDQEHHPAASGVAEKTPGERAGSPESAPERPSVVGESSDGGVDAKPLARRASTGRRSAISAGELESWLQSAGFAAASADDGALVPTARAREIGGWLEP